MKLLTPTFLGLLLLAGLFTGYAEDEKHSALPPVGSLDCFGVNIHFTEAQPGELEAIRAAGFRWVRMDLTWAATEQKPGIYDFTAYEKLVEGLEQNGLKALFILDYGNPIHAEPKDSFPFTSRAGTKEFRRAYADWAAAAVRNFAGKGYVWEIWNEPNHGGFWKPKPDAKQYVALAEAACRAIKKAAPGETIIGPATSTIDLPYLEECFRAGLLDYFAAVSVHPYRQSSPESVEEEYRALRLLIKKYSKKTIPIVSGEWGYSEAWPGREQPIVRQFLTNLSNEIALSIWYDWRDDGESPTDPEHRFGLVKHKTSAEGAFVPKQAYRSFQLFMKELDGFSFSKRLYPGYQERDLLEPYYLFSKGEKEQKLVVYAPNRRLGEMRIPASQGSFSLTEENDVKHPPRTVEAGKDGVSVAPVNGTIRYLTPNKPNDFLRICAASPRAPMEYSYHWPEPLDFESNTGGLKRVLRNPLNKPIRLIMGISSDDVVVKPHGVSEPRYGGWSNRDAKWADYYSFKVQTGSGHALDLVQQTMMLCENPIGVELEEVWRDKVQVRILNPSGEAATLFARCDPDDWKNGRTIEFQNGVKELVLTLPLGRGKERTRIQRIYLTVQQLATASGPVDEEVFSRDFGSLLVLEEPIAEKLKWQTDGDAEILAEAQIERVEEENGGVRLRYKFTEGWKFIQVADPSAKIPLPEEGWWPDRYSILVRGDGKGGQLRIRFRDESGQTWQSDGPLLNFEGWRRVEFPMRPGEGRNLTHWGGANDGKIHYPIQWDSILLLDNVSRQSTEGTIEWRQPAFLYK